MSNVEMMWIGWYQQDASDKIWGWFLPNADDIPGDASGRCWVFWGRRGGTMSFKRDVYGMTLLRTQHSKEGKGYKAIDRTKLLEIWPGFDDDLASRLTWCVLTDRVR